MESSDYFSNSNSLLVNNSNNMPLPTKTPTYYKEKAVLVTVYVEKLRRRASLNHHDDHHHRNNNKNQLQKIIKQGAGKGYNRRAELLQYCQRLRESARSAPPIALQSKPVPSNDQPPPSNKSIITVERKPKYSKTPACFDKWGISVPSFLRSLTILHPTKRGKHKENGDSTSNTKTKRKAARKSPQMQKKWRFFSKSI